MKQILRKIFIVLGIPMSYISVMWLKYIRNSGIGRINERIFMNQGLLPVTDHYYQPMINPSKHLTKSLREDRVLPGIDMNIHEQLELLSKFNYNDEMKNIPIEKSAKTEYYFNNGSYCSGDAEYLYNIIRYIKPRKIIEIGSGYSTLMAINAVKKNNAENSDYKCEQICIEPYEQPWLEKTGVKVIREKAENLKTEFYGQLNANDILFIDSSHIIRPQGDVLFEYQEILPILKKGVYVHVHDIFTPKDYLDEWIFKEHLLWNEQYLLESFLTFNTKYKIIGALNFLSHNYRKELESCCPVFAEQEGREPGAFWMKTIE